MNQKIRPKVAVIGTGAAGFGALSALLDKKSDLDIVVFDIGEQIVQAPQEDNPSSDWITSFYNQVYKKIRALHPFKFPPPKTHLAEQIPKQAVGKKLNIFKSESFGGLTNYWGGTMLPFTDREMAKWPITKEELYPYYQKIAKIVGLAGRSDSLNQYFKYDFSTRPLIQPTVVLNKLDQVVNESQSKGKFKIVSGLNRCALETRQGYSNKCVYCGECMAGCFKDSVFSARQAISQYLKNPQVRYVKARVRQINKKNQSLEIETDDGKKEEGFAKIFLGAGCPASTEIMMRSLGMKDRLMIHDNAVYVFPIFYLGRMPDKKRDKSYLSLCNIILGCLPKETNEQFAQVQVYPNFDYLWRYNIPPKIWPIIRPLLSLFRPRVSWGRLFVHSDYSQAYSCEFKNDQLVLDKAKGAQPSIIKGLMSSIRTAVNHKGFYIPPIPPVRQRVNSHYAGALPLGSRGISSLGEVMPNVYLCDSACFPDSPAVNPAFTTMANAYRVADQSL